MHEVQVRIKSEAGLAFAVTRPVLARQDEPERPEAAGWLIKDDKEGFTVVSK